MPQTLSANHSVTVFHECERLFAAPGGSCFHYTGEYLFTHLPHNISLSLLDDANKMKTLNIERA